MKLLKMNDVADILNVSLERAYALARDGTIPVVYIGRQVRVEEDTLYKWINSGGQKINENKNGA